MVTYSQRKFEFPKRSLHYSIDFTTLFGSANTSVLALPVYKKIMSNSKENNFKRHSSKETFSFCFF